MNSSNTWSGRRERVNGQQTRSASLKYRQAYYPTAWTNTPVMIGQSSSSDPISEPCCSGDHDHHDHDHQGHNHHTHNHQDTPQLQSENQCCGEHHNHDTQEPSEKKPSACGCSDHDHQGHNHQGHNHQDTPQLQSENQCCGEPHTHDTQEPSQEKSSACGCQGHSCQNTDFVQNSTTQGISTTTVPDCSQHQGHTHTHGGCSHETHHHCDESACGGPHAITPSSKSGISTPKGHHTHHGLNPVNYLHDKDSTTTKFSDSEDQLESGPPNIEYIVLNVEGMTCSHCEGQLKLALLAISAIQPDSIKTSNLLSRAEFNLNTALCSPESVMARIKRSTSFRCSQIFVGSGQYIDVVLPDSRRLNLAEINDLPTGVTEIATLDKSTARIFYQAENRGVRQLLSSSFPIPLELAPMRPDESVLTGQRVVRRLLFLTCLSIILTVPVLVMSWAPLPHSHSNEIAYNISSLVLATLVQIIAVIEFYPAAFRTIFYARTLEMDMLIAMSTSVAYIFSVVAFGYFIAGSPLKSGEFFETSTMLVTLVLVGRLLTELSRRHATNLVSVRSLQVTKADLITPGTNFSTSIDTRMLQYNDLIRVAPHSRIVTDGIIVSGQSEIDESMITGESIPVAKGVGSQAVAGSVNGSGELTMRVIRLPCENTIAQIANLVDKAKLEKPKIQQVADYVAGWLVPIILTVTIIVFVAQFVVRIKRGVPRSDSAVDAITYAVATLIISCPCAIGLAVPMVVVIATGLSAKSGIIFKDPQAIESARDITHVVFDKTGTLTKSFLQTEAEYIIGKDSKDKISKAEREVIRGQVLGLLKDSTHPVSQGVATYLRRLGVSPANVDDIKSEPGNGVVGRTSDHGQTSIHAGNSRWIQCDDHPAVRQVEGESMTTLCVRINGYLVAVFGLRTPLRDNAKEVVSQLQTSGIQVHIVSGDNAAVVEAVRAELGVPIENTKSKASPGDKQEYIKALMGKPRKESYPWLKWLRCGTARRNSIPVVLFCGDGTNDAPALKLATIGVHMPTDTQDTNDSPAIDNSNRDTSPGQSQDVVTAVTSTNDVASASANIVLVTADLGKIVTLIKISKAAVWRIRLNFVWSGIYNVIAILGASGALEVARHGWRIPPAFAAIGEAISVAPVILIALTLHFNKF